MLVGIVTLGVCNLRSMKQRENQSVDKWLNKVRIIAHKCEFASDCCSRYGPIRILEKFISGLFDDDLRRKFQYQDCALEDVLNTLSAVEMANEICRLNSRRTNVRRAHLN